MAEAGSAKVLKDPDVDLSEWLRHWGTPGLPKLWPGWWHVVPRCPMLAKMAQCCTRKNPKMDSGMPHGATWEHLRTILGSPEIISGPS